MEMRARDQRERKREKERDQREKERERVRREERKEEREKRKPRKGTGIGGRSSIVGEGDGEEVQKGGRDGLSQRSLPDRRLNYLETNTSKLD